MPWWNDSAIIVSGSLIYLKIILGQTDGKFVNAIIHSACAKVQGGAKVTRQSRKIKKFIYRRCIDN